MMRFTGADGLRVLSKASAEELGRVLRYVVDVDGSRIRAIHVAGRRDNAHLVPWDAVVGFGPDAVIVTSRDAVRGPEDETERRAVEGDLDLDGRLVLTDTGRAVGIVRDVEFDEESGDLTQVLVGDQTWAADGLVAIGPFCMILEDPEPRGSMTTPQ